MHWYKPDSARDRYSSRRAPSPRSGIDDTLVPPSFCITNASSPASRCRQATLRCRRSRSEMHRESSAGQCICAPPIFRSVDELAGIYRVDTSTRTASTVHPARSRSSRRTSRCGTRRSVTMRPSPDRSAALGAESSVVVSTACRNGEAKPEHGMGDVLLPSLRNRSRLRKKETPGRCVPSSPT